MRGPIAVALTTCVLLTAASMAWGEEPAPSITVIGSGAASGPSDTAEVDAGPPPNSHRVHLVADQEPG